MPKGSRTRDDMLGERSANEIAIPLVVGVAERVGERQRRRNLSGEWPGMIFTRR